jgi:haloalkane dehalogenase
LAAVQRFFHRGGYTSGMFPAMQTLRTPDERFADLPEFPYTPRYCDIADAEGGRLRVAWVEDGPADADPVLMLHGEPSWSFLYRRMIPILVTADERRGSRRI